MSKVYLKIKIKSLSEEINIIRFEERKWRFGRLQHHKNSGSVLCGLQDHRIRIIRPLLRSSYLAYAFVRGKSRVSVEHKCGIDPDYREIARLSYKYRTDNLPYKKDEFVKLLCDWLFSNGPYDLGISPARSEWETLLRNSVKNL